jgi:hypothetical protein
MPWNLRGAAPNISTPRAFIAWGHEALTRSKALPWVFIGAVMTFALLGRLPGTKKAHAVA